MKISISIFAALIVLLSACTETEIGRSKDIEPNAIAQDFTLKYYESDKKLIVNTKFRVSGLNGTTLVLDAPSKVLLNNNVGILDSTKFEGAYYTWTLPLTTAKAQHTITYIDKKGKTLTNNFTFSGFELGAQIPEVAEQNKDLLLMLNGLNNGDEVLLELRDTASNKGAEFLNLKVNNNTITIATETLKKLKKGNITLQIMCYKKEPLKQLTGEAGMLNYDYHLNQRNFTLK